MLLKKLIDGGESQCLEFKESLGLLNEIGETISAFSNSNDGFVIIGVSDNRKILGVDIGNNSLEELANYIKRNTDPQIFPCINTIDIDERDIIKVEIKENPEKPVFFKNHAYKRVGTTNLRISSSEIRKLAKESGAKNYWDERISEEGNLDFIDREKLRWFLEESRKQRGLNLPVDSPIKESLMKLKLLKNGELTNAASISNKEYVSLNIISRKTATTDLKQLVMKGLLTRVGDGKRNILYVLPDYAKITQKNTHNGS
ncbi:hypothetical protein METP2_00206 [Methanosarcinales archaeon]|nr:putative DNA binding domain-containing protein [Candidatus Methanoperedens sp.]CAG0950998.1 hypothetical protein METP2_00206 [Methanosarcinales archaeon]